MVCFSFELDRGIVIEVQQSEQKSGQTYKKYKSKLKERYINNITSDLLALRIPQYKPVIQVEIPKKDAKTVFKALPYHAKVALKM